VSGAPDGPVLVTGATGFVGAHLVRRLVAEGAAVHVLRRPSSDFWRLPEVVPRLRLWQADLLDPKSLADAIAEIRPARIFHLASATVVAGVAAGAAELVGVNLLGTVNLIEACEATDYRAMVITGDSFEYAPGAAPLAEDGPCRPAGLHGITKLAATLHAQAVAAARGRPIVVLRLFSAYGPGDHPRRLVPRLIRNALAGEPIRLSRPEVTRDWIHVDDVVSLYLEAALRADALRGRVFNAGTGRAASIAEIVARVLEITGGRAPVEWGSFPMAEHDAHPWVADMRTSFAAFDWRPRIALEDGLRAMAAAP